MITTAAHPEPQALLDDLLLLEHEDPGSRKDGMSTNSYALLENGSGAAGGEALLVDATFDYLMPSVRELAERGYRPAAIVLTHRHILAGNGTMLDDLAAEFGDVPVLLHPIDVAYSVRDDPHAADHPLENIEPSKAAPGVGFLDPIGDPTGASLLAGFGVEALHFPGHTEGSVVLYRERDGLLLSGDAAMGTTVRQAAAGIEEVVRPWPFMSVDDARLRRAWLGFERPVSHLAPYHGRTAYLDRPAEEMREIMRPLTREEPTGAA